MIDVQVVGHSGRFHPGQSVQVNVVWEYEKPPKTIELQLEWHTEGKGDTDIEEMSVEVWRDLDARGQRTWEVVMPRGPLSLEGVLISIRWAIHCTVKPSKDERVIPFLLSHGSAPVRSTRVEKVPKG